MKQEHLAVQVRCSASMAGLDGAFVNEERSAAVWYNTMPVFLFARSMPTSPKYAYLWPVSATTTAAVSEREVKLVYCTQPAHTHKWHMWLCRYFPMILSGCGSEHCFPAEALASLNLAVPRGCVKF